MDPDFWHDRWQTNQIGFHQDRTSPMLAAHWGAVGAPRGSRIFVPLCGKTLDMPWLVDRGHRVLGAELSPIAVDGFFDALGVTPEVHASKYGKHYVAGAYELILGDAFALDAAVLADCAAVYDRAALIALPPDMRTRYLRELYASLPAGCRGLVVTLEYPQHQKEGPPFSVGEAEVRAGLERDWSNGLLERRDILADEPGFVAEGLTALSTVAYALRRHLVGAHPGATA